MFFFVWIIPDALDLKALYMFLLDSWFSTALIAEYDIHKHVLDSALISDTTALVVLFLTIH